MNYNSLPQKGTTDHSTLQNDKIYEPHDDRVDTDDVL